MFTHARIRIGAVVIFAVGLTINLIAILMPRASLYPIAMIIAGVGAVGLYGSRWLCTKTQSHASGNSTQTAACPKSLHHNDSPPVTNNRVGAYLTARPLLLIVWFSFVGTVAITVGVIAMANRSEPQNLVGGVIAILFGLVSLMAAYYVYQKRR